MLLPMKMSRALIVPSVPFIVSLASAQRTNTPTTRKKPMYSLTVRYRMPKKGGICRTYTGDLLLLRSNKGGANSGYGGSS
jgi:hypothetical protein